MNIEKHYDEIARCNRCGFCQVACPIFRATGHEAGVARGRLALLRALIEKRIEWNRELEEPLFACLLCGACTANCFPAVATADLMLDARSEYLDRVIIAGGVCRMVCKYGYRKQERKDDGTARFTHRATLCRRFKFLCIIFPVGCVDFSHSISNILS